MEKLIVCTKPKGIIQHFKLLIEVLKIIYLDKEWPWGIQ